MALSDNQVRAWHFNESSGNATDSIGGLVLTNNGTITYGAGLLGNAATIAQSSTQYFNNTSGALFGTSPTAISVNLWVKVTSQPTGVMYLGDNDGATEARAWTIYYDGSTVYFRPRYYGGGNAVNVNVTQTLTTDSWFMLTLTDLGTSATDALAVYINASQTTATNANAPSANDSVAFYGIGRDHNGNQGTGTCVVDECGVWTRQISSAEVTQLYNGGSGIAYPYTVATPSLTRGLSLLGVGQ